MGGHCFRDVELDMAKQTTEDKLCGKVMCNVSCSAQDRATFMRLLAAGFDAVV